MSTPFWDTADSADGTTTTAPGVEGALYMANEWDTCQLHGVHVPGLVYVDVASRERRVQTKKQNGTDGATQTFRGMNPAKLTINVCLWTPDQLSLWDSLLPIIYPNPSKDVNKLSAMDISHPATHQHGISAIIITNIRGPYPGPQKGSKCYDLMCEQYIPPPPQNKSATKTIIGAVKTTKAFQPVQKGKNTPVKPSSTDFGPNPAATPQQGST